MNAETNIKAPGQKISFFVSVHCAKPQYFYKYFWCCLITY